MIDTVVVFPKHVIWGMNSSGSFGELCRKSKFLGTLYKVEGGKKKKVFKNKTKKSLQVTEIHLDLRTTDTIKSSLGHSFQHSNCLHDGKSQKEHGKLWSTEIDKYLLRTTYIKDTERRPYLTREAKIQDEKNLCPQKNPQHFRGKDL